MELIRHRVNRISEVAGLARDWGAEIDLRSRGERLILQHDAFLEGDDFEAFADEWAKGSARGTLVLNPKEDGLEAKAAAVLAARGIENYFLVDVPAPAMVRLAFREGCSRLAVRVSEYEPLAAALVFSRRVRWAWVDTFNGTLPEVAELVELRKHFRICLVSPELHQHPPERIDDFLVLREFLDAVCTKFPDRWKKAA